MIPALSPLHALPRRLAIGVSGGLDSVALLHALIATGKKPEVWHFDHAWRASSITDARFVEKLARAYGLCCVSERAHATVKISENTARQQRWDFFLRVSKDRHVRHLVLAHTANDQVETFLWQLLRGTGSHGSGMPSLSTRGSLTVHRPWLGVWREAIETYAKAHGLAWRNDPTNRNTKYTRNRLRHRLLPYLRKTISPHVDAALWRAAEIQRAEQEWLDRLTTTHAQQPQLSVKQLRRKPLGQIRRIIKGWLQSHGIADLSFDDVEQVRKLLTQEAPAKVNLSNGRHARRRAGWIFLE